MPEVSRFFGIVIVMYYNDHNPPHFHVRYGHQNGIIDIATLTELDGALSSRVVGIVREWANQHQSELRANWTFAREGQPLIPISPLE